MPFSSSNGNTLYKLDWGIESLLFSEKLNSISSNDESGLYLSVSYNSTLESAIPMEELFDKNTTFSDLIEHSKYNGSIGVGAYIVANSPWSDQYLILFLGIGNIGGKILKTSGTPYCDVGLSIKFPEIGIIFLQLKKNLLLPMG